MEYGEHIGSPETGRPGDAREARVLNDRSCRSGRLVTGPVTGLHVFPMIQVEQLGHAPNQVFLVLVNTAVSQGYSPYALQDTLLGVLAELLIELAGTLVQ
jgi:hypothetical protein